MVRRIKEAACYVAADPAREAKVRTLGAWEQSVLALGRGRARAAHIPAQSRAYLSFLPPTPFLLPPAAVPGDHLPEPLLHPA